MTKPYLVICIAYSVIILIGGNKKPSTAVSEKKRQEIQKVTQEIRKGELTNPNAIIIPQSELLRMKNNAVITTKEEQMQQRKILEEQNEKQQAAAKAKKQRMLEIEAERKKNLPPTETEMEEKMKSDSLQSRVRHYF